MGLVKYLAKEMIKEIGNKSREFFEFVLPPVDMHLHNNSLIVTIDIPGFKKDEINLSINGNILSIRAEKKESTKKEDIICNQRPNIIDKKIRLPIKVKEGEEKVNSAKYSDGILILEIPTVVNGKKISID